MKEGFIVSNRDKSKPYKGIDASSKQEVWKNIEHWNESDIRKGIILNYSLEDYNIIYKGEDLHSLILYSEWLRDNNDSLNIKLLYFSEDNFREAFIKEIEAKFLGIDCVFIEDEFESSILFSTVYNELGRGNSYEARFVNKLNHNNLFDSLSDASEYREFRQFQISKNPGDFETAFQEVELTLVNVWEIKRYS